MRVPVLSSAREGHSEAGIEWSGELNQDLDARPMNASHLYGLSEFNMGIPSPFAE